MRVVPCKASPVSIPISRKDALRPWICSGGALDRWAMGELSSDGKKLILFIDDDPSLLYLGRRSLERAGYRFAGALGGLDGLRQARLLHPDLILLDYMMPDLSGKDVFDKILASDDPLLRRAPVIMLTARTNNPSEQHDLLNQGLAAYLCKPFGYHELLNVIDNVLVVSQVKERNRRLEAQARQSFIATVRTLIMLLFAKDPYTGEHSNMTAELAGSVALYCGLPETEVTPIKLGALLHDVGKIGVPECVLCKPAGLTAGETHLMRRHVHYGEQALCGIPNMETVCAIVKHHHEWWDGGGYPSGLRGEESPLGARIIAVVDAFDAMTSDRPYRKRLPQTMAVERLQRGAGTQFDPVIVEKFVGNLGDYDINKERSMNLHFLDELLLTV